MGKRHQLIELIQEMFNDEDITNELTDAEITNILLHLERPAAEAEKIMQAELNAMADKVNPQ